MTYPEWNVDNLMDLRKRFYKSHDYMWSECREIYSMYVSWADYMSRPANTPHKQKITNEWLFDYKVKKLLR